MSQSTNKTPNNPDCDKLFGEVIYTYTRAQAIEDGVLIDATEMAKETGFKWPVALTAAGLGGLCRLERCGQQSSGVPGSVWTPVGCLVYGVFRCSHGKECRKAIAI